MHIYDKMRNAGGLVIFAKHLHWRFSFTKFAQLDQAEAAPDFILQNINKGGGYVQ